MRQPMDNFSTTNLEFRSDAVGRRIVSKYRKPARRLSHMDPKFVSFACIPHIRTKFHFINSSNLASCYNV
jgi:hypothetical protein